MARELRKQAAIVDSRHAFVAAAVGGLFVLAFVGLGACTSVPPEHGVPPPSGDPSRFAYTRIYCMSDSETRFENVSLDLVKLPAAAPLPPIYIVNGLTAASVNFTAYEPRWGAEDFVEGHYQPVPVPLFAIILEGAMSIKTSNGETRRFRAGDVIRVEDTTPCRGHISVNESDQILRVVVAK